MSESIESKITNFRETAGLSLLDMAKAIGITEEQMTLIESGSVSPNLSTLLKISQTLGIRLGTLLDGAETEGPVVTEVVDQSTTVRIESGINNSNLNFFALAKDKSDRNMEPLIVDIEYSDAEANRSNHEGEEFLYVLDGEVRIIYGTQTYNLKKGDSIYYDSIIPHLVSSAKGGETAKVLAVVYTPA